MSRMCRLQRLISAVTCASFPVSYIVLTFQNPILILVLVLKTSFILSVVSLWLSGCLQRLTSSIFAWLGVRIVPLLQEIIFVCRILFSVIWVQSPKGRGFPICHPGDTPLQCIAPIQGSNLHTLFEFPQHGCIPPNSQ